MAFLYKSASGREVTHGSNSSIEVFRLCRRKFKLSRIDGWRQKDKKASLEFGKCIESAVQYYHDNGLKSGDGPEEFRRLWAKWIDQPLVFTSQENSWRDLNTMGLEMTRLYEIMLPTLPIKNPKWQLQYLKKLWPGTNLDDLEFMAYVDLLSTLEDGSRLVIDIKTAKSMLSVTPGMMALDGQLRKYAWVSGIRDVGFLNFVKAEPEGYKKGSHVTLLDDTMNWKAGTSLTVLGVITNEAEGEETKRYFNLGTEETVRKMDEELDQISGKGSKEKKEQVYQKYALSGEINTVPREAFTKCRLQFVRGLIPEEELVGIGQQIGTDMIAMKSASDSGTYPLDGGVRFPNAICGWCEMLPICNPDPKRRDETLYQIAPTQKEKDWLEELEEDGGE